MDQPKLERLLRLMKLLTANNTYTVENMGKNSEKQANNNNSSAIEE
jgi:hypothetical protein